MTGVLYLGDRVTVNDPVSWTGTVVGLDDSGGRFVAVKPDEPLRTNMMSWSVPYALVRKVVAS